MPRSREEEAGVLYEQGSRAVRAGGHQLDMLTSHLRHMLMGVVDYPGALWQVRRVPPEGRLVELEHFKDYLLLPVRRGLELPSLYFLRQALTAMPDGPGTLQLVREQFTRELMDFDALADRERETALLKCQPQKSGRPKKGVRIAALPKSGTERQAAQLAQRHPDLAQRVRKGEMKLNAALLEAGIRKRLSPFEQIAKLLPKLSLEDRHRLVVLLADLFAVQEPVDGVVHDAAAPPVAPPAAPEPLRATKSFSVTIDSGSPPVWADPPPLEDGPQQREGGQAVLIRHCAVIGLLEQSIRAFKVSAVEPYAQYERSVVVSFVHPRERKFRGYRVHGNLVFYLIRVGNEIVYDSRRDVPCDMAEWSASQREMAERERARSA